MSKLGSLPRGKFIPGLHQDVISHHISVKDLIDTGIIYAGDQVWFKEQTGTLQLADTTFRASLFLAVQELTLTRTSCVRPLQPSSCHPVTSRSKAWNSRACRNGRSTWPVRLV